jgi:LacI family transcriptional regulator
MPEPAPAPAPVRRKRGARFVEIAQEAGVSVATVNRVLNELGSVAPGTRARVVAAAKALGVPRALPDLRHGLTRFDVILARSTTPFFRRLELGLARAASLLDRRIVVHRQLIDEDDDEAIARAILRPAPRRDGLVVAVHDTPRVREALRAAIAQGTAVVTMMSDIGELPRLHYAGIDNVHAGRTAGHFIGRLALRPGRVLLLTNSLAYRAHADRVAGCRDAIAARFPQLACGEPVECFDERDRVERAVVAALREGGDLVGLYHSGAGAQGVAEALVRAGRAGDVAWVGHELSDEHRTALASGVMDLVIDQDPDGQVLAALAHLLHACGWNEQPPSSGLNEFRLFCAENLPARPYLG